MWLELGDDFGDGSGFGFGWWIRFQMSGGSGSSLGGVVVLDWV